MRKRSRRPLRIHDDDINGTCERVILQPLLDSYVWVGFMLELKLELC